MTVFVAGGSWSCDVDLGLRHGLDDLADVRPGLLELVQRDGIALVTGVPCRGGEVQRFAEQCVGAPVSHGLLYGAVFDVKDEPDPVNIAYTSLALAGHQDLVYYESPPGLQLLHCLRFDGECSVLRPIVAQY